MNTLIKQKDIKLIDIPDFQLLDNKQSRDFLELGQSYRFNGCVVFLIKGQASIEINNELFRSENSVIQVWLYSHIKLLSLPLDTDFRMILVNTGSILEPRFYSDFTYNSIIYKYPHLEVGGKEITEFIQFWDFIYTQQNLTCDNDQVKLNRQLVYALFLKEKSICVARKLLTVNIMESSDSTILQKFLYLIFHNMWSEKTVNFYAEKLNVSISQLSTLVEAEWGDTAENWISYARLIQIIAEISKPSISMIDVAKKFHISLSELEMILEDNMLN